MTFIKTAALLGLAISVSGCVGGNRTGEQRWVDSGIDSKSLSQLVAGIWVDPNGCDHWIIDDGLEGYLSERMQPDGRPVCSGVAPPNTAVGPFRAGTNIPDPL
ncbi:MAG: hypothetical protein R6V30_05545 [Paracoccaceae bacterium]|nr:hypothetical protein [Loktanella sp.]